jgi:Flp pilus assembly protein TadB
VEQELAGGRLPLNERAARTRPPPPEGHTDRPRSQDRRVSSAPLRPLRLLIILVSLLVGGVILYVAQAVLMPMALAVLLTFVLAPVVGFLERRRLGGGPASRTSRFWSAGGG